MSDIDDWGPPARDVVPAYDAPPKKSVRLERTREDLWRSLGIDPEKAWGTINCLALDATGDLSGITTTSGLAFKIPGRIGDSPMIGCGLYVDNEIGAAGSTGVGEECIKAVGAHTVVESHATRHVAPRGRTDDGEAGALEARPGCYLESELLRREQKG